MGTLADNGHDLLSEYSAAAIAKNIEFSPRHLKLRVQGYAEFPAHQFRLPGLVAAALPDGGGLRLMDQVLARLGFLPHQLSPLDRLAFLGDRAMGALTFEPAAGIALPADDVALLTLAREVRADVALALNAPNRTAQRRDGVVHSGWLATRFYRARRAGTRADRR